MVRRTAKLAALVFCLLVIAGSAASAQSQQPGGVNRFIRAFVGALLQTPAADSPLVGKPAPDLALKTVDGKDVKLSDQKGSVVLMDFWATWCPPCRASLPHVQKLSADKDLAAKGLKVWAVNSQEDAPTIQKFVGDNKFSFNIPMATQEDMQKYQIEGIPTTVIVGRDGTVKNLFVGYGGEESDKQIEAAIDAALAAK